MNSTACELSDTLHRTAVASLVSAMLAVSLLIAILIIGRMAFKDRERLLSVFLPGFKITGYVGSLLSLINGILLAETVYLAETYYFGISLGVYNLYLVGGFVLGGLAAAFCCVETVRSMLKPTPALYYLAKALKEDEASIFWQWLGALASKIGATMPEHVVLGIDTNFFVTQHGIRTLDGPLGGRILYLSLPLCRLMTTDELEAVVAHELAHFAGRDTEYSLKFYPIYQGVSASVNGLGLGSGEQYAGLIALAAMPVTMLMRFFLGSYAKAVTAIGRDRELEADAVGSRFASPRAMASALTKLHIFSPILNSTSVEIRESILDQKPMGDPLTVLAAKVADRAKGRSAGDIQDQAISHPYDTHPAFRIRMKNLNLELPDVVEEAFNVSPTTPASSMIPQAEALERGIWQGFIEDLENEVASWKVPPSA